MSMEEMYKKAYDFLLSEGFHGIYMIKDVGDSLVFYGGNPNEVYYGIRTASVNKETGKVEWFDSNANRAVLKQGKELDIPEEYKYKAS